MPKTGATGAFGASHPLCSRPMPNTVLRCWRAPWGGARGHLRGRAGALAAGLAMALPSMAWAQLDAAAAERPVRFYLEGGAQFIAERDPFWGLGQQFAPDAAYPRSLNWLEASIEAGLTARQPLGGGVTA